VVEIAGPAGAGKTAVLRSLKRRSKKVTDVALPRFRSLAGFPFFAEHGLLLLPTLLRLAMHNGRGLTYGEIRSMITLNGWHRLFRTNAVTNDRLRFLDQAAVFMMAELHEFGPESLRSTGAHKWWSRVHRKWAKALDLVIWLDASDAILRERIQSRRRWHVMKNRPAAEVVEFLARYRHGYEQAVSALTAYNPGLRVLRIDTGDKSVDQVVDRLMLDLGLQVYNREADS
jgi:shikimate kinase